MLSLLFNMLGLIMVTLKIHYSFLIAILFAIVLFILLQMSSMSYTLLSWVLGGDKLCYTMLMISLWIVILMIMASSMSPYFYLFKLTSMLLLLTLFLSFGVYDYLLFYIFFESVLIPTFVLILGWGFQPERLHAGLYMLLYTLFASLPFLLGLFALYSQDYTLNFFFLYDLNLHQFWGFALVLAFLVKLPLYLLHVWLPRAHVEAPVGGSMILAGVLLKLGGYGLLRINGMIKYYWVGVSGYLMALALLGGLVMSFVCILQYDIKMLVAYSSVVHMALVLGGLMCGTSVGVMSSLIIMLAHGLCSSCLFCLVNVMYMRFHSRSIMLVKGLLIIFPNLCLLMFLFCICNMSAPPSFGLVGEIFVCFSLVQYSTLLILPLMIMNFMCAIFSLYLFNLTSHGKGLFYSSVEMISVKEYIIIILHWLPLNVLFLNFNVWGEWI